MKRTTISLPHDLAIALEREARRRGQSVSAVIRQTLAERFGLDESRRWRLPFVGLGHSGRSDIAEGAEEVLADEWRPDRDR